MTAKIGTVTLTHGVQQEDNNTNESIAVINIPMGSPVIQIMGQQMGTISFKTTVSKSVYASILTQQAGSPMVSFNAGDTDDEDYGIIIESINKKRSATLPDCLELTISGFTLDYDVANVSYDLSSGSYDLIASSQLVTDDTDVKVDDYVTRLVLTNTEECSFYVQTSPTGTTWTSYPDSIGWVLKKEKRVIDLSHLTGYLRVVANNTGTISTAVTINLYLSKQE